MITSNIFNILSSDSLIGPTYQANPEQLVAGAAITGIIGFISLFLIFTSLASFIFGPGHPDTAAIRAKRIRISFWVGFTMLAVALICLLILG